MSTYAAWKETTTEALRADGYSDEKIRAIPGQRWKRWFILDANAQTVSAYLYNLDSERKRRFEKMKANSYGR